MGNFTIVARYQSPVHIAAVSTGIVLEFAMKAGWMKQVVRRIQEHRQRFAPFDLLTILKHQYPDAQILGHYQLSASPPSPPPPLPPPPPPPPPPPTWALSTQCFDSQSKHPIKVHIVFSKNKLDIPTLVKS